MEKGSGENDLRSSAEDHLKQPVPPPAFQGQYSTGGGGWGPPQQSEVIEDRGLGGYRLVAKIIDYFVVNIVTNIILTPITFIWILSNIGRLETLSKDTDPDVQPWDFFGDFLWIWAVIMALSFTLTVLYYFVLETKFQQTAGKKAFDLKVIDVRNGRASTLQLLARAILYTLSMMLYFWIIELIVALIREDGRSVTDIICGTTVIRAKKIYHYGNAQTG